MWSKERPKNHRDGIVFPGTQTTTWTRDTKAKAYYFHRFYAHQADLNTWNPYVRAEIQKIMGFWLELGVSGFRMDAVPFLIEKKGANVEHQQDFGLLKEMREFLQWRSGEAILLAEANVPPDESMKYFGEEGDRGIRRRLAPMLGGSRRKLELAFSLLFSLPGTPMMQYGDEIGMGEDLRLPERECARTPMQWTDDKHAGFSTAARTVWPVVNDAKFGYKRVNASDQRREEGSLLNRTARFIRTRRECPEISWGDFEVLRTNAEDVLAIRYDWRGTSLVTLHNFSGRARTVRFSPDGNRSAVLADLMCDETSQALADGSHRMKLEAYGFRWLRVGGADETLIRAALSVNGDGIK